MTVKRLHVTSRYCEVAISGNLVHLAGQLADDTSVDITAQTQQTLDNIDRLLAGSWYGQESYSFCHDFSKRY